MDSFEINKIVAAVLMVALLVIGISKLSEVKISSSLLFASAKRGSQLSSHHFILSLKTTGWQGGLQLLWQCIVWSSIFAPNIFAPNILKLIWCGGRECYGRE